MRVYLYAAIPAAVAATCWLAMLAGAASAALTCNGLEATIVGTNTDARNEDGTDAVDDVLSGTPGADVIMALAGDDYVGGGAGNDTICSGSGVDKVIGGTGDDWIRSGPDNDSVEGNGGSDVLSLGRTSAYNGPPEWKQQTFGNLARCNIFHADATYSGGVAGDDTVYGGSGQECWNALGKGNDIFYGYAGNDVIYAGPGNDDLVGGVGADTAHGNQGDDECSSFEERHSCL